ncbi:glycosyltransferase family 2 protein [Helicobacter sp. 23-1045]
MQNLNNSQNLAMTNNSQNLNKSQNLPAVACIVTNYNYGKFLLECIDSIKNQHYPNLQIIVVDDGSSDNSLDLLAQISEICVVKKQNGGQLSAFNAGFSAVKEGCEIVFFIDSDDLMNANYIARCVEAFAKNPNIDYIFCKTQNLYNDGKRENCPVPYESDIGFGLYATYFGREYFGVATSCICIKTQILRKILPLDLEDEWKIRADDCIIYGASLVGANIYHLDFYGISYRIHGENNYNGKKFDNAYLFRREIALSKLFEILRSKNHIFFSPSSLYLEFLNSRTAHKKRKYIKITLLSNLSIFHKMGLIFRILKY